SSVIIVGRDEQIGRRAAEEIGQSGGRAAFFRADVSLWGDALAMAQFAIDQFGGLDVLVSNAGVFPAARIVEMSEGDWDHVQAVNLKGTFFAVKACYARMQERRRGRIVLTSSITGPVTGFAGWSHYGASKA